MFLKITKSSSKVKIMFIATLMLITTASVLDTADEDPIYSSIKSLKLSKFFKSRLTKKLKIYKKKIIN